MSKKEFEELIKRILFKTGMTQEELSIDSGRNKGYISQTLSRGNASPKYVELLKAKYLSSSGIPARDESNWERAAIKSLTWKLADALSQISELKSKPRPIEEFVEEIDKSTTLILNDLRASKM